MDEWRLEPSEITTRDAVSREYGGAKYGGIQPSSRTPNVILYSDPEQGRKHGYNFDGWSPSEPGVYYYTGEGQTGDQALSKGNKAILESGERGKALRLFEAAGPAAPGGKPQRYIGAFEIDSASPWRREQAADSEGLDRTVLVFRLKAVGADPFRSPSDEPAMEPSLEGSAVLVGCEQNVVESFEVSEQAARSAVRREAILMRQLEEELSGMGHSVRRLRITPRGQAAAMLTDPFDETTGTLFEVKATSTRESVRTAIGQLYDYARYAPDAHELAVVLPEHPGEDLADLVHSRGMALVHPGEKGFVISRSGTHQRDITLGDTSTKNFDA